MASPHDCLGRGKMSNELFRQLPAIDKWLASEMGVALSAEFSAQEVAEVMRADLERVRRSLGNGLTELPQFDSLSMRR